MKIPKWLLIFLITISLCLLIPGITLPIISLKANLNRKALLTEGIEIIKQQKFHPAMTNLATNFLNSIEVTGTSVIYNKTRSILGTSEDLWNSGYHTAALLIIIFSIIIPLFKLTLLLLGMCIKKNEHLFKLNNSLSKWSMADVFAMGVLIAFMATNSFDVKNAVIKFDATLHAGFYWFVSYCLISNIVGQLAMKTQSAVTNA